MADEDVVLDVPDAGVEFVHLLFQKQYHFPDVVQDGQYNIGTGQVLADCGMRFHALEQPVETKLYDRKGGLCTVSDYVHNLSGRFVGLFVEDRLRKNEMEQGFRFSFVERRAAFCRFGAVDGLLQ